MAIVAVVSVNGDQTIFASVELAKKSIEFSCHKLEGKVTYTDDPDGSILATCPDEQVIKIEEVHVFDRVTHL